MKKLYAFALLLALSLAQAAPPAGASGPAASNDAAAAVRVGAVVPDFELPDAGGRRHTLASLKGKAGTVLIFVGTRCPVSNAYNARMQKLAEEYRTSGVNVVGINSNASESAEDVKRHAAENGLTFPILKDAGARVADRLGAEVTPEAYLLDAAGRLVYRGRIDNSRRGDTVSAAELRDALESVLAGKPVEKPEVKAFGCSIKRR